MNTIKIITNEKELEDIANDWTALCNKVNCTPFQYPQWQLPWWKHYGNGELITYAAYENNKLKYLAPVFIRKLDEDKEVKVVFTGTGNTDYLDIIASPEDADVLLPAFFSFLYSLHNRYDHIVLSEIPQSSVLLKCKVPGIFNSFLSEGEVCHKVNINRTYEDFLSSFSRKRVKNLLRMEKKLSANGGFTLEKADKYNAEEFLNDSAELNRLRWSRTGTDGVLNDDTVRQFNLTAIKALMDSGNADLLRIRNGSKTIAVEYILKNNGTAYDYIHSNNPEYEKYSPGLLMRLKSIEYLISDGLKVFDFLKGDEEYKNDWETYVEKNFRMTLYPVK